MSVTELSVVDLFCGCGGFGLGAELAGFQTHTAIDIDDDLQSAYRLNFPHAKAIQADIRDLDASAWHFLMGGRRPDGVIGGPPCQGFSRIGKRDAGDPRNTLISQFFDQVRFLRPKFFVLENVEGLLDPQNVDGFLSVLEKAAERFKLVGPVVVNAADCGAATVRRRVVVVGYDPLYVDPITLDDIKPSGGIRASVREAIADLPDPVIEKQTDNDFGWAAYRAPKAPLSRYARQAREMPQQGVGWLPALQRLEQGYASGFSATKHTSAVERRFGALPQGAVDRASKYPRLEWDGQCPTLRAGTGKDRGSFQAVRPVHPTQPRVITVREAARMQGFPDWFVFHPTKWHSFRMIGNSVSPMLAQFILSRIRAKMINALAA